MHNILITGSRGQLGSEIRVISKNYPAFNYFFADVDELDITVKQDLEEFAFRNGIDAIVNCAAYTAVDAAETHAGAAYAINRDAVRNIGEVSARLGIKVIHISTDYVFDGTNHVPYDETMPPAPATVYGKSKLEGEEELIRTQPGAVVIRTSWLYSSFGNNFVKTMMKLGRERDSLNVIFDQIGTPTYAADLAEAVMQILGNEKWHPGLYHFSNEGVCSWYDFAKSIHRSAGISCQVNPIETKDYPAPAPRPYYSVLNKAKIKSAYSITIPHWQESLEKCIAVLNRP